MAKQNARHRKAGEPKKRLEALPGIEDLKKEFWDRFGDGQTPPPFDLLMIGGQFTDQYTVSTRYPERFRNLPLDLGDWKLNEAEVVPVEIPQLEPLIDEDVENKTLSDFAIEEVRERLVASDHKGFDIVERPAHYNDGLIEVWDFIVDKQLSYCLGNVVKYVCRAGKKDPSKHIEDLKKAEAYLKREIKRIEDGV